MITNYYWKPPVVLIAYCAAVVVGQLEDLVLGGNYGSSLKNIPNLRSIRERRGENTQNPRNQDFQDAKSYTGDEEGTGSPTDSRLIAILKAYAKNYGALMIRVENLTNILETAPLNRKCKKACKGHATSFCYLECITVPKDDRDMPIEEMKKFRQIIAGTANLLCKPLNTSVERLFTDSAERSKFNSVKSFRAALGLTDQQSVTRVRRLMVSAIYGAILRYTNTALSPLKHLVTRLHQVLRDQFPGSSYDLEPNSRCLEVKIGPVYDVYVQALKKELSTRNSYFPGFAVTNSISKYISTKSSFRMTLVLELFRMISGRSSGFGCLSTPQERPGDGTQLCDYMGKSPILGFPIPPNIPGVNSGGSYMTLMDPLCVPEPTSANTGLPPSSARSKKNKKKQ